MNDQRPDPDALLSRIQRQEEKSRRGRLKVFFGAAAGVGKTYAILAEACWSAGSQAPAWESGP